MSESGQIIYCENCGTKNGNALVCIKCNELLASNCAGNDFSTPCSSASELIRLHDSLNKSLITNEEFRNQKRQVFCEVNNKRI